MGGFTGMGDLRGGVAGGVTGDMSNTPVPTNPIYVGPSPDMPRNVPSLGHMPPHVGGPPMSAAQAGPSHYNSHQLSNMGTPGPIDERMSEPEMSLKAEKDAIYKLVNSGTAVATSYRRLFVV